MPLLTDDGHQFIGELRTFSRLVEELKVVVLVKCMRLERQTAYLVGLVQGDDPSTLRAVPHEE